MGVETRNLMVDSWDAKMLAYLLVFATAICLDGFNLTLKEAFNVKLKLGKKKDLQAIGYN